MNQQGVNCTAQLKELIRKKATSSRNETKYFKQKHFNFCVYSFKNLYLKLQPTYVPRFIKSAITLSCLNMNPASILGETMARLPTLEVPGEGRYGLTSIEIAVIVITAALTTAASRTEQAAQHAPL